MRAPSGLGLALVFLLGCVTEIGEISSGVISCSSDDECPGDLECNPALGTCVSPTVNQAPALALSLGGQRPLNDVAFVATATDFNRDDTLRVELEYRDGGSWLPATLSDGGAVTANEQDGVLWVATADLTTVDSISDDGTVSTSLAYASTVEVRGRAVDSEGATSDWTALEAFELGNEPPVLVMPSIEDGQTDAVVLELALTDSRGDLAGLDLEFDIGDGVRRRASLSSLDQPTLLTGVDSPQAHRVVWFSREPLDDSNSETAQGIGNRTVDPLRVFVRVYDEPRPGTRQYRILDDSAQSEWLELPAVRVQNQNTAEIRALRAGRADIADGDGPIPITFNLVDLEGEPADVEIDFSIDGGTSYAPCREYPAPESEGKAQLLSSPGEGVEHRFVWDPSGVTLVRPASTRIRVRARATESLGPGLPSELVLTQSIGPVDASGSALRATEVDDYGDVDQVAADFNDDGFDDADRSRQPQ